MIKVERAIPQEELIETMHRITLASNPDVLPYEHADITVEEVTIDELSPTTLYVIKRGLSFQRQLREGLKASGFDPLLLTGGLQLRQGENTIGLVPPIVEDDPEHGPCLIDGAHRTYVGRQIGQTVMNVIHIRGALSSAPIYALPNEWHEIIEYDETPADPALKKRYRENPRELYRDFSALNGSAMREPGKA